MSSSTTPITLINPQGLYDPRMHGYTHVAMVPAGTRMVFIAGQGGADENGEYEPDFQAQVRRAFHNLKVALEAAGGATQHVAKLTIYIVDHTEDKLPIYGAELEAAFGKGLKPAATLVPVSRLALDCMLFEIDAIACIPT